MQVYCHGIPVFGKTHHNHESDCLHCLGSFQEREDTSMMNAYYTAVVLINHGNSKVNTALQGQD